MLGEINMNISKRMLFICLLVAFISLIAALACTIVLKFNLISLILLGLVVLSTIATTVISWRAAVIQNRK